MPQESRGASAPPEPREESAPPESRGAGVSAQRRSPPSIVGFNGPGSRANSGDSWPEEEEKRDQGANRVSPPSTTASQWRGEDVTHSIALQLQRARQMLNVMVANPESTKYKMQPVQAAKERRTERQVQIAGGERNQGRTWRGFH